MTRYRGPAPDRAVAQPVPPELWHSGGAGRAAVGPSGGYRVGAGPKQWAGRRARGAPRASTGRAEAPHTARKEPPGAGGATGRSTAAG